ncbi:MAG TPA: DUF2845 domain-containing protein [Steroidobacteraceae bacterium]|nr:DUF2845 domain-containing protein [Steroidobacteraceae bacterium]
MRTRLAVISALAALAMLPLAASAESMRCGKWVVSETSSAAEILEKCGEPQKKDISHEDVYARNALGYNNKVGVKVTERWRYQESNRALPMLVTIVDGKVVSIERTE